MKTKAPEKKAPAAPQSDAAPARREELKSRSRKLLYLRGLMLALCCIILVVGLLLVILPLFRIQTIEVKGNVLLSNEEVIALSGVEIGQETLQVNLKQVANRIDSSLYVSDVRVSMVTPFRLRIVVEEKKNISVTTYNGSYYTFDESFVVLEETDDAESVSRFLKVKLPEIEEITVGSPIQFANAEADVTYCSEMVALLSSTGLAPYVTELDCEQKYDTSFVLGNSCRIEFGKADDISRKLQLAQRVLLEIGVEDGFFATVNVSNPQKPTYRTEVI